MVRREANSHARLVRLSASDCVVSKLTSFSYSVFAIRGIALLASSWYPLVSDATECEGAPLRTFPYAALDVPSVLR